MSAPEGNYGEQIGLTKDWAERIVKLVGNYGEVFERNVGAGSLLKIDLGLNNLWNKGGILYAPSDLPLKPRAECFVAYPFAFEPGIANGCKRR